MSTGQHVVDPESAYLARCGLGEKYAIVARSGAEQTPTPLIAPPAPSYTLREDRVVEKAERDILNICARIKMPQGFVTDIAQDILEEKYALPSIAEDLQLLELLQGNHPLRCGIVGAAYKLRVPKTEANAGDLIGSVANILSNAGLANRLPKVIALIEGVFPAAKAEALTPGR